MEPSWRRQATDAVTFRTLDIGGDKILPYMQAVEEENPALGWRAIRIGLDRPGLLRAQVRALLKAGAGRHLQNHVPDGRDRRGVRARQGAGRAGEGASRPARLHPADAGVARRDDRGAFAPLPDRRDRPGRRFPVGRLQRSHAVPVRGRPRKPLGRAPVRSVERARLAGAAPDRGAGRGGRAAPSRCAARSAAGRSKPWR